MAEQIYTTDAMAAIQNVVPILIARMDDGEIVLSTPPADKMFGYVYGELVGMNIDDLVPISVKPYHAAHRKTFAANPKTRSMGAKMVLHGKRRDGVEIQVVVSLVPAIITRVRCVIAVVFEV